MRRSFILFIAIIFTVACTEQTSQKDINEKINKEIAFHINVPKFEGFILNYAAIHYGPSKKHKYVKLGYAKKESDLPALTEEEQKLYEKQHKKVLLGNPKSVNDFFVRISDSKIVGNSKVKTISRKDVQYNIGDKNARFSLNTDSVSYSLNVIFSKEVNEETGFDIMEQLVKQLKN